jgi:acetyl esterase/lipase
MVSGGWVSRWSPPDRAVERFDGLLERGFTVLAVRHGSSPRYKVPEAEADVRLALRYVRLHADDLRIDADRLGVYGGSAGGHLSLMLGLVSDQGLSEDDPVLRTPSRVAAVVAYYPPVDLTRMVGPSERFPALDFAPELAEGISPVLYATPDDPPTLLIHGDADRLVNVSHSERMYAALQSAGVESEFVVIPGGDHGFTRDEDRARAEALMVAWFDRLLGTPQ